MYRTCTNITFCSLAFMSFTTSVSSALSTLTKSPEPSFCCPPPGQAATTSLLDYCRGLLSELPLQFNHSMRARVILLQQNSDHVLPLLRRSRSSISCRIKPKALQLAYKALHDSQLSGQSDLTPHHSLPPFLLKSAPATLVSSLLCENANTFLPLSLSTCSSLC